MMHVRFLSLVSILLFTYQLDRAENFLSPAVEKKFREVVASHNSIEQQVKSLERKKITGELINIGLQLRLSTMNLENVRRNKATTFYNVLTGLERQVEELTTKMKRLERKMVSRNKKHVSM